MWSALSWGRTLRYIKINVLYYYYYTGCKILVYTQQNLYIIIIVLINNCAQCLLRLNNIADQCVVYILLSTIRNHPATHHSWTSLLTACSALRCPRARHALSRTNRSLSDKQRMSATFTSRLATPVRASEMAATVLTLLSLSLSRSSSATTTPGLRYLPT